MIRNICIAGNGGVSPVFWGVAECSLKKPTVEKMTKRSRESRKLEAPKWMDIWIFLEKILGSRDAARENWAKHALQLSQSVQATVTKCHRLDGL